VDLKGSRLPPLSSERNMKQTSVTSLTAVQKAEKGSIRLYRNKLFPAQVHARLVLASSHSLHCTRTSPQRPHSPSPGNPRSLMYCSTSTRGSKDRAKIRSS